jgi:hypothetical protein
LVDRVRVLGGLQGSWCRLIVELKLFVVDLKLTGILGSVGWSVQLISCLLLSNIQEG